MPNITVYWYRHNMQVHHHNLELLMEFYDAVTVPLEHRESFKALVIEMEDVFNSAFADEYNTQMERLRKTENTDDLPF